MLEMEQRDHNLEDKVVEMVDQTAVMVKLELQTLEAAVAAQEEDLRQVAEDLVL